MKKPHRWVWPLDTGCKQNLVLRRSGARLRPLGASYMGVLLMGLLPDGCLRAAQGAAVPGIQAERRLFLRTTLTLANRNPVEFSGPAGLPIRQAPPPKGVPAMGRVSLASVHPSAYHSNVDVLEASTKRGRRTKDKCFPSYSYH